MPDIRAGLPSVLSCGTVDLATKHSFDDVAGTSLDVERMLWTHFCSIARPVLSTDVVGERLAQEILRRRLQHSLDWFHPICQAIQRQNNLGCGG